MQNKSKFTYMDLPIQDVTNTKKPDSKGSSPKQSNDQTFTYMGLPIKKNTTPANKSPKP